MGNHTDNSMIHVCFGLYDRTGRYSKFLGTTMLSLFENSSTPPPRSTCVHILHDNTLTKDNRDKFSYLAEHYEQLIKFYNVEELCADRITEIRDLFPEIDKTSFSIAMVYRFFISYVLPDEIEKVIYLDADIIVNLDLKELWQVELDYRPLGAIPNLFQIADEEASINRSMKFIKFCINGFVKPEDYFNSGVLLMNLKFLRNNPDILNDGIKFVTGQSWIQYFDQDVLNYCFSTTYLKLPVKFNRFVMLARPENEFTIEEKIYHYAGGKVSLTPIMSDSFSRLWWSYFIKTPWFDVDTLDRIFKGTQDSMLQPSDVPPDKTRVFIVDEAHAYQIERNFSVRADEQVIVVEVEVEECRQKLTDLMSAAKDKSIFFVGIPNITPKLKEIGLVEGKNFFDVSAFYSPAWANRQNNYNLILEM